MDITLTSEEQKLIDYAKESIVAYNKIRHEHGGIDTLYSFLFSNTGKIYDGACYEPNIQHATVCGERHAIQNMILHESYGLMEYREQPLFSCNTFKIKMAGFSPKWKSIRSEIYIHIPTTPLKDCGNDAITASITISKP